MNSKTSSLIFSTQSLMLNLSKASGYLVMGAEDYEKAPAGAFLRFGAE